MSNSALRSLALLALKPELHKMKTGFTNSECPGCGKKNERKKDSVCPECLEMLATGRAHVKLYNELKMDKSIIECQAPFGWDSPRFSTFRTNQHNPSLEPVGKILAELSRLVSVPAQQQICYGYMQYLGNRATFSVHDGHAVGYDLPVVFIEKRPGGKNKFDGQGKVVMPKKIFDCLNKLEKAIDNAIEESERGAVEYGKNALIMLNDGKITMEDFNKS